MAKDDKKKKKGRPTRVEMGEASARAEISATGEAGVQGLLDEGLAAAFESLAELGVVSLSAEESLGGTVCLPMPALAPRFLFQAEGLVLGRIYLVAGPQESCKSAFLAETGTWHRRCGGFYQVIETEQKDAAGLRHSFFNYDLKAWRMARAYTQDEWNSHFFRLSEAFQLLMDGGVVTDSDGKKKKVVGKGRTAPVQFAVDSISAVTIAKFSEKTREEGAPSMNHPLHAKMLSDFLKEAPKLLVDYPMTMFMVSHEKYSSDPRAPHISVRNTSGGSAPKFQVTTDISMKRLTKHQYVRAHPKFGEIYSIPLGMQVFKNSMGAHESIQVEMTWYFDPDDRDPVSGQKRQRSYFDWHSASIELLMKCMVTGDEGKGFTARRTKALRELVDLEDCDKRCVTSTALGIGDPVSYREAGIILEAKIQSDPDFALALYDLMGVRRQFMFKPGVDLREQIAENTRLVRDGEALRVLGANAAAPVPEVVEPPPGI